MQNARPGRAGLAVVWAVKPALALRMVRSLPAQAPVRRGVRNTNLVTFALAAASMLGCYAYLAAETAKP